MVGLGEQNERRAGVNNPLAMRMVELTVMRAARLLAGSISALFR
jgi:hypothetical protein